MSAPEPQDREPEDLDGLAAEYVLGTLELPERAAADQRLASDPGFARDVAAWQYRLLPLLDAIPEARVPEGVFYDVRVVLAERGLLADRGNVVDLGAPMSGEPDTTATSVHLADLNRAERRARGWRRMAFASGAIAACLLAFVVVRDVYQPTVAPGAAYVAVLETNDRTPAFAVSIDVASGTVSLRRIADAPQSGKSHQLWALGAGRAAPESLGLVRASDRLTPDVVGLTDPDRLGDTTFAISLEPEGGSPTGQPTGPVVFTGKLVAAPAEPRRSLKDTLRELLPNGWFN